MSRSRLVTSLLAMALVPLFGGRLVVGAFPLRAAATPSEGSQAAQQAKPGQTAQQAKPGQTAPEQQAPRPGEPTKSSKPTLPPPKKIYDVKPVYPPEAAAMGVRAGDHRRPAAARNHDCDGQLRAPVGEAALTSAARPSSARRRWPVARHLCPGRATATSVAVTIPTCTGRVGPAPRR